MDKHLFIKNLSNHINVSPDGPVMYGDVGPELVNLPPDFSTVREFERQIAAFFGAPSAVAVDSCTHGLELCLRYTKAKKVLSPNRTYLSVPMLANKLNISLEFWECKWIDYYWVRPNIIDAAVFWKRNGYNEYDTTDNSFMCISFQYQKHLALGRGGMILCPDEESAASLRRMAYDGRLPGIPWREQNVKEYGYHYYMTPETAQMGLDKLPAAIATPPRIWTSDDYPMLTKMDVFK